MEHREVLIERNSQAIACNRTTTVEKAREQLSSIPQLVPRIRKLLGIEDDDDESQDGTNEGIAKITALFVFLNSTVIVRYYLFRSFQANSRQDMALHVALQQQLHSDYAGPNTDPILV